MQISKMAAIQIVEEISNLVKQNINLMDETGHIIASCDPSRIGTFHDGSWKVISEKLDEYYVPYEEENENVKQGLNLPLELDGEIVGVVGITGPYEEVIHQGKLLKKMTEILLQEKQESHKQLINRRVRNSFLEEWLIRPGYPDINDLEEKGKNLGIDIHLQRRIMIVSICDLYKYRESQEGQEKVAGIESALETFIQKERAGIYLRNNSKHVLILKKRSTEKMVEFARKLWNYLHRQAGFETVIGIDQENKNLRTSYQQAYRAWRIASDEQKPWVCYENLALELLMDPVEPPQKLEYVQKVFGNCTGKEILEYLRVLQLYFQCDGSINETAAKLYIHKNTLQYRLNRLKDLSGYDVRKPRDGAILYVAMQAAVDLEPLNLLKP